MVLLKIERKLVSSRMVVITRSTGIVDISCYYLPTAKALGASSFVGNGDDQNQQAKSCMVAYVLSAYGIYSAAATADNFKTELDPSSILVEVPRSTMVIEELDYSASL